MRNYGWNKAGKEVIIKKFIKKRTRYTLICGMSLKGIEHYKIVEGGAKSDQFNSFIRKLQNKNAKKYLLMDNATIHHNKDLLKIVSKNKIVYNAPYSPEYNPIEMLFSKLKRQLYRQYPNKLTEQIDKILKSITQEEATNYFSHTKHLWNK
jgi:transposase